MVQNQKKVFTIWKGRNYSSVFMKWVHLHRYEFCLVSECNERAMFAVIFIIFIFEILDNQYPRGTSCADWTSQAAYYRDGELASVWPCEFVMISMQQFCFWFFANLQSCRLKRNPWPSKLIIWRHVILLSFILCLKIGCEPIIWTCPRIWPSDVSCYQLLFALHFPKFGKTDLLWIAFKDWKIYIAMTLSFTRCWYEESRYIYLSIMVIFIVAFTSMVFFFVHSFPIFLRVIWMMSRGVHSLLFWPWSFAKTFI